MENKITYEASMKRLEEIVRLLEKGSAPLDESIGLFEEATRLVAACENLLDTAEQKVKIIVGRDGGFTEENFEDVK